MLAILPLLLACDPEPEVVPPTEPIEEEVAVPTSPGITAVDLKMTSTLTVGDALPIKVAYTLPDACWDVAQALEQPEPLQFVLTVTHTRRDGMCAQMMTPQVVSMKVPTKDAGTGSLTVIVDGQTLAEEVITVSAPPTAE